MDGYAVRAADAAAGPLRWSGEVAAGDVATATLEPGTALGITTGAPIPPGADAVLQSEHAELADGTVARDRADRRRAATSASAARTSTPATCSRPPASG